MTLAEIQAMARDGLADKYYGPQEWFRGGNALVHSLEFLAFWQLIALSEGRYNG